MIFVVATVLDAYRDAAMWDIDGPQSATMPFIYRSLLPYQFPDSRRASQQSYLDQWGLAWEAWAWAHFLAPLEDLSDTVSLFRVIEHLFGR